jgi:hypothetical protein
MLMAAGLAIQGALGARAQGVLPPLTVGSSPRLPGKFVWVKSVKDTVAQAKQLGGSVPIEPRREWLDGKVAVVVDPTGAALGVMEWPEDLVKGAP